MRYMAILTLAVVLTGCSSSDQAEPVDHTETNPFETVEPAPDLAVDAADDAPQFCLADECVPPYDQWDWCTRDFPPSMCGNILEDDE